MTEDASQRVHYQEKAGQWFRWQATARQFVCAANLLLDSYDPTLPDVEATDVGWRHNCDLPMMVLYAIAAENLLKALRVAQGEPATEDGRLNKYFRSHNMLKYATDARLDLSADDTQLLLKLRDLVESGKYPIAKSPTDGRRAWTFEYPRDVERVFSMLERLEGALRATGKPTLVELDLRRICRGSLTVGEPCQAPG